MTKFRHLIWMLIAASGSILSASQSHAQLRQPDVGDQPGLVAESGARSGIQEDGGALPHEAKRSWLARMVAAEVRSAYRSSWHSLMRFSMSPRAQ